MLRSCPGSALRPVLTSGCLLKAVSSALSSIHSSLPLLLCPAIAGWGSACAEPCWPCRGMRLQELLLGPREALPHSCVCERLGPAFNYLCFVFCMQINGSGAPPSLHPAPVPFPHSPACCLHPKSPHRGTAGPGLQLGRNAPPSRSARSSSPALLSSFSRLLAQLLGAEEAAALRSAGAGGRGWGSARQRAAGLSCKSTGRDP